MKKLFRLLLIVAFLGAGPVAQAQQGKKIPRIGFLSGSRDPSAPSHQVEAFRHGLRELGYIEGKNIIVEYRYAEGRPERMPMLIAELVQLRVDVIVTSPITAIRAAKDATKTIPIVIVTVQDPVAAGFIDSLARPGGNITGLTLLTRELSGKRLELLKEMVRGLSRAGVLGDVKLPGSSIAFKEYETAARALKIKLHTFDARGPDPNLERAIKAAAGERVGALVTIGNPALNRFPARIAELAIKYRLPSLCEASFWVEAGCLTSYSSNDADSFRRAAVFVDKLLKGTKPADLPVEQPMKFEFVINLKTANQIGLTIPQWTLMKADKVIK